MTDKEATTATPPANEEPVVPDMIDNMWAKLMATPTKKWITIGLIGTFSILYFILTAVLYKYGFAGFDPKNCYFVSGLDVPALTREAAVTAAEAADVTVSKGYPINMGHMFRVWFKWGFWSCVVTIVISATATPMHAYMPSKRSFLNPFFAILAGIGFCNAAAWFLLGLFWRLSLGGRISSGEKIVRPDGTDSAAWKEQL